MFERIVRTISNSAVDSRLRLHLAGSVRLFFGDEEVSVSLKKSLAMLAIVAISAPQPVSRDKIAALLWGDSDQKSARTALRQILHRLRGELGVGAQAHLSVTPDEISLKGASIDVVDAMADIHAGASPALLENRPDAFLEVAAGLDFADPNFASWIAVQRQRLHEDAVYAIGQTLGGLSPPDDRGMALARLLSRMEPTHEAAARFLMLGHHAQGNIADALSVYNQLWSVLEREFDAEPSDETQRLIVDIKQGSATADALDRSTSPSEPAASDDRTSAAENPVANFPPIVWVERFRGTRPGDDGFLRADALRVALVNALSRFGEWRVIDSEATAPKTEETGEVAAFALSGVVVADSLGLEVVLTVRDMGDGKVVWSETVRLSDEDWGRMQRRAVRRIATAFNLHLSANRMLHYRQVIEAHVPAHDAWLLGQTLLSRWAPESEEKAEALFRGVLADYPDFAPASVGLAQVLNARHHISPGPHRSQANHREALRLCLHAVGIDPLDAKAQLTLGWSLALNGMWENAIATLNLAHELNENDSWVLVSSALGLSYCADYEQAAQNIAQVTDLGMGLSSLHWAYIAGVRFMLKDYSGSADASILAEGANCYIGAWHCAALGQMDRLEEAGDALGAYVSETRAKWQGETPASDAVIMEWLLQCYPMRRIEDWQRLRDGLAAAGAPVPETPAALT